MDCRVVVEAAIPVYDVETPEEAIRIAIAKTGEMLNPDLNYVEISMGSRTSPEGEELPPAFIAADEALVALELEMIVFNVEQEEHASRIARKEIGQRLDNVPLTVLEVEEIEEAEEVDEATEETDESAGDETSPAAESADEGDEGDGDDLLPEFEDLVEDS
ncbi:MAG: DUF555 domain-containing protein [Haloferacaceae archaeon]